MTDIEKLAIESAIAKMMYDENTSYKIKKMIGYIQLHNGNALKGNQLAKYDNFINKDFWSFYEESLNELIKKK